MRSRVRARACASRKVTARNYAGRPGVAHDDSAFAAAAATATTLHSFVSPMSVSAFFATSLPAACGLEETSSSPKAELLARCCAACPPAPSPPTSCESSRLVVIAPVDCNGPFSLAASFPPVPWGLVASLLYDVFPIVDGPTTHVLWTCMVRLVLVVVTKPPFTVHPQVCHN